MKSEIRTVAKMKMKKTAAPDKIVIEILLI